MTQEALNIGLVAHDAMKQPMADWVAGHKAQLAHHQLYATGTTAKVLMAGHPEITVTALKSGPLGGDQQLGAMISEGRLDVLIFFQDPMTAQPHDVDVKALVRLSTLYDVPIACNPATADLIISSPQFPKLHEARGGQGRVAPWQSYLSRTVPGLEGD